MTLGSRVVVLRDGYVQQVAPPLELFNEPANMFVAGFIGSPPMNFVTGTLRRSSIAALRQPGRQLGLQCCGQPIRPGRRHRSRYPPRAPALERQRRRWFHGRSQSDRTVGQRTPSLSRCGTGPTRGPHAGRRSHRGWTPLLDLSGPESAFLRSADRAAAFLGRTGPRHGAAGLRDARACATALPVVAPDLVVMLSIDGLAAAFLDDPTLELPALPEPHCPRYSGAAPRPDLPHRDLALPHHASSPASRPPGTGCSATSSSTERPARSSSTSATGPRSRSSWRPRGTGSTPAASGRRVSAGRRRVASPRSRTISRSSTSRSCSSATRRDRSGRSWRPRAAGRTATGRGAPRTRSAPCRTGSPWRLRATSYASRPPRLLLLHFLTLDSFQHDYGDDEPRGALGATRDGRALVGRSSRPGGARSAESTTLLVFGDHGFVDVDRTHHLNQILREERTPRGGRAVARITRRLAWAAGNGGAAHVYVLDGAPRNTRERGCASASPRCPASTCSAASASRISGSPRPGPARPRAT